MSAWPRRCLTLAFACALSLAVLTTPVAGAPGGGNYGGRRAMNGDLVHAIDDLTGLVAREQQLGIHMRGVDRALRELVQDLIRNDERHRQHHQHHQTHRHHFMAGMHQAGGYLNVGRGRNQTGNNGQPTTAQPAANATTAAANVGATVGTTQQARKHTHKANPSQPGASVGTTTTAKTATAKTATAKAPRKTNTANVPAVAQRPAGSGHQVRHINGAVHRPENRFARHRDGQGDRSRPSDASRHKTNNKPSATGKTSGTSKPSVVQRPAAHHSHAKTASQPGTSKPTTGQKKQQGVNKPAVDTRPRSAQHTHTQVNQQPVTPTVHHTVAAGKGSFKSGFNKAGKTTTAPKKH